MTGTFIIIVLLMIIVPVSIIMTGLLFSGILGTILQKQVDSDHEGTELYELSRKNYEE